MLDAGNHYSTREVDDETVVNHAIEGLMLDALDEFDPKTNIIEWAILER